MRKENSIFHMKFLSQSGVNILHNNDYYGCSELEEYACYVVADGISSGNEKFEDPSARMAVEAVIAMFNEQPSMSKGAMKRYCGAAHTVLRQNPHHQKLKASITIVVTNYEKLRYGYAGNSRFHLYRSGKLIKESRDHSLSWSMMEEGQLPKDKIALHEERNNLTTYLGQAKSFSPTISKAIKLNNNDIFSLLTRGIWENADQSDMLAALKQAENDPDAAVDNLERLILDKTASGSSLENYTICVVFVDKVYKDPKRSKRIKWIIIIAVLVLVLAAVITFLVIRWNNKRQNTRNNMESYFLRGIEYIQSENFASAQEEMGKAYAMATDLRDRDYQARISSHQILVSNVLRADELLQNEDYTTALDAYHAAEGQSHSVDNIASRYIQKKMDETIGYLNVYDYIYLGDALMDSENYTEAEKKYLIARSTAAKMYYAEGKQKAVDALTELYEKMQEEVDAQKDNAQAEVTAGELIVEGDNAFREGDLVGAQVFYELAKNKYTALGNRQVLSVIEEKMTMLHAKSAQNEHQAQFAAEYMKDGDEMLEQKEYVEAKRFYLLARGIYADLGDVTNLDLVQSQIELVDTYLADAKKNSDDSSEEAS